MFSVIIYYSASCDVVKSVESRRRILTTSGRCYNCLKKGHQAKNCSSEGNCRHCKKRHHQSICVTENLCSKLNLKAVKRETLTLNTFGENRYKKQRCDRVELYLQKPGNSETVKISALKYPVKCSALPSRVNVHDYPHLQDLEFAENFNNDGHDTIDVLIGSDYYWDIITNESIRADSGPTAVSSKFGWILSG